MEIRYKDKKIKDLCEKRAVAVKKLGQACARKLMVRLQALEAATRVTDLVAGNPHPLTGDRYGEFALDLSGGWRMTFVPGHDPYPTKPDGGIDWSQVTIATIEYIGNYHD